MRRRCSLLPSFFLSHTIFFLFLPPPLFDDGQQEGLRPIVTNGTMYISTPHDPLFFPLPLLSISFFLFFFFPLCRVIALNAETGKTVWVWYVPVFFGTRWREKEKTKGASLSLPFFLRTLFLFFSFRCITRTRHAVCGPRTMLVMTCL